jgi:hypothetical protein
MLCMPISNGVHSKRDGSDSFVTFVFFVVQNRLSEKSERNHKGLEGHKVL